MAAVPHAVGPDPAHRDLALARTAAAAGRGRHWLVLCAGAAVDLGQGLADIARHVIDKFLLHLNP
jgi:hypothetical protein